MQKKPNYGIDAPGVVRNLLIVGLAVLIAGLFFPAINLGPVTFTGIPWIGTVFLATAALMILYSKVGKFRHAARMVRLAQLKGSEQVLDVGTGRGLLLIEAARKLTTGRATGIDIWNAPDLSGNLRINTETNITIESAASPGLQDRCELKDEPAQQMSFPNASFDVVLSNMCLHNIEPEGQRNLACEEIARVLKPGGLALISDYKNTQRYAQVFESVGLQVSRKLYPFDTFPPVFVVFAKKPVEPIAAY